jgi:hypothetical protein
MLQTWTRDLVTADDDMETGTGDGPLGLVENDVSVLVVVEDQLGKQGVEELESGEKVGSVEKLGTGEKVESGRKVGSVRVLGLERRLGVSRNLV